MKWTSSIIRWVPLVIIAFALVSIIALLKLDWIVSRDLGLYGLEFSLLWANPYWIAIGTALAMLSLVIAVAIAFQVSMLLQKGERKTKDTQDRFQE